MIDYIKYTVDGKIYELVNNEDGTWGRDMNAPSVSGKYNLLLEIGQSGIKTYIDSSDTRYNFYLSVIREIERKVDLIRYVPQYLQTNLEFNIIFDSENIEIDYTYDKISNTKLDMFIRTSSNEKIIKLEDFLRIKGLGNLEQRKTYLLALFQKGKKLSEGVIKEVTNTITGSDCIVTFFGADEVGTPYPGYGVLQVQVLSPDNQKNYRYDDIFRALKPLVPAHIKLLVIKYFATWEDIMNNYADWSTVADMEDWQAVKSYIPPQ